MSNRRHEVYANRPMPQITEFFASGVIGEVLDLTLLGDDNDGRTFFLDKKEFGLMVAFSGKSTDREHWDMLKVRAGTEEDKLKYG